MMQVKAGQLIGGRFVLTRELGKGGFGRVWLAREKRLGRDVAIKMVQVLDREATDEEDWRPGDLLTRFAVEARAIAGLDHPGVPAVYDWSTGDAEADEPPYLAMQYIRGKNLGAVLKKETGGRLTIEEAACLGAQLSSILAAVHSSGDGIFHRDLKPENIMVTNAGRVSLIDFGSAFIVAPHRPRVTTRSRIVPGTSGYIAPEIIYGRSGPANHADLYALGCIIYRVLGGPVFDYETDSALDTAHMKETPQPLRERNPDVPEELDRLVMQLLEKEPCLRPASAREVFERLRPFLPIVAPGGVERVRPHDVTLPFRDPCRPPETDAIGGNQHQRLPPRTVGAVEVDPTASIENLRRVRDLTQKGQNKEACTLIRKMVSAQEEVQGLAGVDVRKILSTGTQIFLDADDPERAKKLALDLLRRARENGVDPSDRYLKEAGEALRKYSRHSSGG